MVPQGLEQFEDRARLEAYFEKDEKVASDDDGAPASSSKGGAMDAVASETAADGAPSSNSLVPPDTHLDNMLDAWVALVMTPTSTLDAILVAWVPIQDEIRHQEGFIKRSINANVKSEHLWNKWRHILAVARRTSGMRYQSIVSRMTRWSDKSTNTLQDLFAIFGSMSVPAGPEDLWTPTDFQQCGIHPAVAKDIKGNPDRHMQLVIVGDESCVFPAAVLSVVSVSTGRKGKEYKKLCNTPLPATRSVGLRIGRMKTHQHSDSSLTLSLDATSFEMISSANVVASFQAVSHEVVAGGVIKCRISKRVGSILTQAFLQPKAFVQQWHPPQRCR